VAVVGLVVLAACTSAGWAEELEAEGEKLFRRRWASETEDWASSDGLGPLFNERSCAACHFLGGLGGAGPRKRNVELLSIVAPTGELSPDRARKLNQFVRQIHPGFAGRTSLVLHKYSINPQYDSWRQKLLGRHRDARVPLLGTDHRVRAVALAETGDIRIGRVVFRRTERNTPALFGAGLVDQIRPGTLRQMALSQKRHSRSMAGRVAPGFGRFGWRGQTASLHDFVAEACANELGLQTSGAFQPSGPLAPTSENPGPDITLPDVRALVEFIRQLPPPRQLEPRGKAEASSWRRGGQLFAEARCQVCHAPRLQNVAGIYSDLLLHDMGRGLSDPSPARAGPATAIATTSGSGSSYSTAPQVILAPTSRDPKSEWRTPPLWGVRDSAPYLHDGRAATIEQAIRLHGGQAQASADYFRQLDEEDQARLIAFVRSLGAP
jgi:CxxC motif-containing protein (DUF1111 family)